MKGNGKPVGDVELEKVLASLAGLRVAVVTCMDTRIDTSGLLERIPNLGYLIRNAGGRVSDDALRSLAAACGMGANRVLVIHHTNCAMAEHSQEEIQALIPEGPSGQGHIDFLTIGDHATALREDMERIDACPMISGEVEISGFVYETNGHGNIRSARTHSG